MAQANPDGDDPQKADGEESSDYEGYSNSSADEYYFGTLPDSEAAALQRMRDEYARAVQLRRL